MRIALAQINPIIGNLPVNADLILKYLNEADKNQVDLVIFPELSLIGYPPKDLLCRRNFVKQTQIYYQRILMEAQKKYPKLYVLLGSVCEHEDTSQPTITNSAFLFQDGRTLSIIHKKLLPTYDVFDDKRYFYSPIHDHHLSDPKKNILEDNIISLSINNQDNQSIKMEKKFLVTICEDLWAGSFLPYPQNYEDKFTSFLLDKKDNQHRLKNIDGIINLSASPFHISKKNERHQVVANIFKQISCPLYYVNQVGANDELIFDGNSFFASPDASPLSKASADDKISFQIAEAKSFQEDLFIIDSNAHQAKHHDKQEVSRMRIINIKQEKKENESDRSRILCRPINNQVVEDIISALTLGISDYFRKENFTQAIIGLSGGIDSAVTACLAARAIGRENVYGVALPSRYSSKASLTDAKKLADNLGIQFDVISIEPMFNSCLTALKKNFSRKPINHAEENLQARLRGTIIMAMANKNGYLALATGNKSELAVGYATLYGDMNGALAVIGDVYKTMVYHLAKYLNAESLIEGKSIIIPENILQKEPSAELRANQKDTDNLPSYSTLDSILERYLEHHQSAEEIMNALKCSKQLVESILKQVELNEYKRHQAPPILKICPQSFGCGRRIPIVKAKST